MNSKNPFQTLKIPKNSNIQEIKQAFHTLIRTVHPDSNPKTGSNALAAELILAYRNALAEAKKNQTIHKSDDEQMLELKYELFFQHPLLLPKSKQAFFRHLVQLLHYARNFFYDQANFSFFHSYLAFLLQKLPATQTPGWNGYLRAIFESWDYLLDFRGKTLSSKPLLPEEYQQEKLRLEIIRYFQEIADNAGNELKLRQSLMISRDYLLTGCISAINNLTQRNYQQEFFTVMSIIALLGEDELLAEWEL